jgi:hypothetical protein
VKRMLPTDRVEVDLRGGLEVGVEDGSVIDIWWKGRCSLE